jgi:hypothetical protein
MAKLIVEEGGGRRAFRMGKGVLTVGSGADARLRLASGDVAEVHLELELAGDVVKLRPRPGVVPPRVDGQPAAGEIVLAPGRTVEVGSARLWIETEGAPPAMTPAAPAAAAPVVTPGVPGRPRASAPVASVPRRAARARAGERPAAVPAWLTVVGILAVVGLVFLAWARLVRTEASGEGLASNKLRAARQAFAASRFEDARVELAGIPASALTPELAERKAALEREISEVLARDELRVENAPGTKYLDTLLRKYEGMYLQGTPEHAKVRLFLQRCRTFRARWPRHPEMDWVTRQEARFAGYVDMNAPLSLADVQWQVKDLTDGMPRNYAAAFALVDEFLTRATGSDREAAQALWDELAQARPEYAEDRLFEARHQFEKKNDPSKAVWWLVHNVAWLGDEALANESARFLLRMPDVEGHLRAYARDYPDKYEAVMRNEIVAGWARDTGFEP